MPIPPRNYKCWNIEIIVSGEYLEPNSTRFKVLLILRIQEPSISHDGVSFGMHNNNRCWYFLSYSARVFGYGIGRLHLGGKVLPIFSLILSGLWLDNTIKMN